MRDSPCGLADARAISASSDIYRKETGAIVSRVGSSRRNALEPIQSKRTRRFCGGSPLEPCRARRRWTVATLRCGFCAVACLGCEGWHGSRGVQLGEVGFKGGAYK